MRVVSVNVGGVRKVAINGRPEPTAFCKSPVETPVKVTTNGLEGDRLGTPRSLGIANHAVYIYPVEHYAFWQDDLEREFLPQGSFGENLTVEGIDETRLRIGDELVVGTARLRVIQPRIPCYKLAHFLNAPQNFPARFLRSARVGAYCAVVEEGFLKSGDPIELVAAHPSNQTIAEFVRLTQFDTNDVQGLVALAESPDLIAGWRERVEGLLAGTTRALGSTSTWSGWRALRCVRRFEECCDVASFIFADAAGGALAACRPGQFLTLKVEMGQGVSVIRTYTISGADPSFEQPSQYRITVKRETRDAGTPSASAALHEQMAVNGEIEGRAPAGAFLLDLAGDRPVVFVSSGIGITPMMAMLHALADAGDRREALLVHGARNGRSRPFGDELLSLSARLPNLKVRIYSSRPEGTERSGVDYDCGGRVRAADVLALARDNAAFFLCGPSSFMRDLAGGLLEAGVDPAHIHAESFGSSALVPDFSEHPGKPVAERALVHFEVSGIEAVWTLRDGTLLDLLEAHGIAHESSCRSGICQTCMAELVSGDVVYPAGIKTSDPTRVLLCSAQPASDLVLKL